MMSSTGTQRAGRAPKDRSNKSQSSQATTKTSDGTKNSEVIISKVQPTAEQLRIAHIVHGSKLDDPDIKSKVEAITRVTGKTSDAAVVALHDCDNDTNRAINMLMDGNDDEGKWETSCKKKKNRQSAQKNQVEVNGHDSVPNEKEEKEPVENTNRKKEPRQRDSGHRYRGPPRMNRGGNSGRNWRNKENEKNERNLQDGKSEQRRNSEGRSRGPRRGRGRGGRSRTFQNRGLQNDGFPELIDTWTNSTAEKVDIAGGGDATMAVGNWSDIAVAEEWSEEDWTENLTETKVFTPSAGTQSSNVGTMDISSATAVGQSIDLASLLQKANSNSDPVSNSLPSTGMSQQQAQAALMSQQMVSQIQQPVAPQTQSGFDFDRFAKQTAENMKSAVGVNAVNAQDSQSASAMNPSSYQSNSGTYQSYGVSNNTNQHHVQIPHQLQQVMVSQSGFNSGSSNVQQPGVHMSHDLHSTVVSQQSASASSSKSISTSQHQPLPQRVKPKARLPPPSKIPESAVVMPDDAVSPIDVQFGAMQFDSSPFDFSATDNSSAYSDMGSSSNPSSHVANQSISQSVSSHTLSNTLPSSSLTKESTYGITSHNTTNQTNMKDIGQTQKVPVQESMLLSQAEHKNVDSVSAYVNHRTGQSSSLDGTMMSNKSEQTVMNTYSSSQHDNSSSYPSVPYGSQKSTVLNSSSLVPSTVNYSHSSSSLTSGSTDLGSSQQQTKYQAQVTQSQNVSYVSGSNSYGMQPNAYSTPTTTSGNTYPSQTGYNSHASGSYGSNNSGYTSQQGYNTGSVTVTTQAGSMLSTSVSSSKLTNSMSHAVKDPSLLESQHNSAQHTYDVASTTSGTSVLTANNLTSASTTNHSVQNTNINSVLGLVSTSSSTTTTSVLKNSLSASKAVPNIPQSVPPMLGHQYIMGQAGLPFYGLQQPVYSYEDMQMLQSKLSTLGLQSPVYSYEDMQMLQSKLSTLSYYDMQFQAPTSMPGRDPGMGSVAYTADGKYSRTDTDASTVATTLSQGQASTQSHGQTFLNPAAALPPGYGYYFAGGMMPGSIHHYAPPLFPVTPATNTHGATTNTQFQKAAAYGSHSYGSGYESLAQTQDYSKSTYGAASQNQVKGVSAGSGAVADLSASAYSKAHAQLAKSYDKPGFHTGTPPAFNLAGNQAGPLGASSAPYAATQFIPVLTHGQHHTSLLHHHMPQDTAQTGGTPNAGQRGPQGLGQQKNSGKQNYAYWSSN